MMLQYKYSIIIPHKDIPELLQRCLDSIPTRDDVQIIIVDDNSNPLLVDFEHFPGKERPNTEIYFDNTNKGAGRARNVGLEYAKGEWVLFADADDVYNTENLNRLLDLDLPEECSMIVFGTEYEYLSGGRKKNNYIKDNYELLLYDDINRLRSEFAPWKKMVRMTHVKENGILFEETIASNDVMFYVQLIAGISENSIYWFPQIVYVWKQRENSIMHTYTFENSLCRLKVSIEANSYAYKRGWGLIDNTREYMWRVKQHSWSSFLKYYLVCCRLISLRHAWNIYYDVCSRDGNRLAIILNPCSLVLLKNRVMRIQN